MSREWLDEPAKESDPVMEERALIRQGQLTKPEGSLGRLESMAVKLSGLQGCDQPAADRVQISVFAADHGVAASGVSAFPQAVTVQMIANFCAGGAAISVLAGELGAVLEVVDVGTVEVPGKLDGVVSQRAGPGTANLQHEDAMTAGQLGLAMVAGRDAVERAVTKSMHLFIGGEMGIGNTTAATAVGCALTGIEPQLMAGPGTGLDREGVSHKVAVIQQALARCDGDLRGRPLEALRRLGGFEIAALAGAYIRCAQRGLPALVDGYIATVAAMVAVMCKPAVKDWLLFSHRSAEPGHRLLLETLEARPLLDLGMRLGEGSGAASAVSLLRHACALHNRMATFADAGVAGG
ncbi:MAG: nicotinate-nucleotide--dimethylbenzimidazole phosphoribosyltransferase [Sedimenticola sp.]|nr:nicotinate-nucleotide--dimethylbenzimidazole phosphoribosyltransferase [Sedimenticola sp.]